MGLTFRIGLPPVRVSKSRLIACQWNATRGNRYTHERDGAQYAQNSTQHAQHGPTRYCGQYLKHNHTECLNLYKFYGSNELSPIGKKS